MRTRLKVCCISSWAEAHMAVAAGADALGLVSAMPSGPGVIEEALIAQIAAATPPPVATFLLTSKTTAATIAEQHARCGTSTIQLVDAVAEPELRALRRMLPLTKLVQVIHVMGEASVQEALAAQTFVDALLLDSGNPQAAVKELGGTGRVHNWALSAQIVAACAKPVFLAGGLNAGNVRAALAAVKPFGLDVCSGLRSQGHLDPLKLKTFAQALAG